MIHILRVASRVRNMASAIKERAAELDRRFRDVDGPALLGLMIEREFVGEIALLSSFGTESAVLLALAAEVDPGLPVLFLDTGQLFDETLAYRDELVARLGLRDVRTLSPSAAALAARDPEGELWRFDTDACCRLRKVEPLEAALPGIEALISGRKRYHGALRRFIPRIEAADGLIKIDPLADWSRERVEAEFAARALPRHPLLAQGYPSVGCAPCTLAVSKGAPMRAGRWSGSPKTECGIHRAGRAA
jgi:phosphoadenosine phosphosulfate reductase